MVSVNTSWENKTLGRLCEITSSKRIYAADYQPAGVPFYRSKEIIEKHKGNLEVSTELFISEEKYRQIESRFGSPSTGDLLLTSVGTLGIPYIVRDGETFYFKDGNLIWFKNFRDLSNQFFYYWLISSLGKAQLGRATIGSSQPALTIVLLKNLVIDLPPLPTQKKIASILSAYDDLIENNNRRIKILEEMAQNIYREWFVHFRYPGHEDVPMVDSELGQIPQGWEVQMVEDRFTTVLGGTPSRRNLAYWLDGTVAWINSSKVNELRVIEASEFITEEALKNSSTTMMPKRTTVVAITGATLGQVSLLELDACANQSVIGIIDSEKTLEEFLYLHVFNSISRLISAAGGGAQQHINKKIVEDFKIFLPDSRIAEAFTTNIKPLFNQITELLFTDQNLRKTRDLLLPKLISGQLDVEELDIAV